ncbi:hypothetical protein V474_23495 [Novosphingobium barchaimii LL02]|uniref:Uncharacterized protein n=1 Tax=Novosphingobium barchaimii LL02 TaxID=1114963 RepID=A0A0J7XMK9_9SPHN|nr:hypothetical protein [Novosphingobium barchaimii]KMS52922.1 hypothetical protein V474_23495 [Novosphingobium barchaimii LL02]
MIVIRTYAALSDVSAVLEGNEVHGLLEAHVERLSVYADFDLTDLAMFAVVMPGDTLDSIEDDLGRSLIDDAGAFNQPPEIIQRHQRWFELAFILSDDGFGLILFVPIDMSSP